MDQEIHEVLLLAKTLTADTKTESIFNVLKHYFIENTMPSSDIVSVTTGPITISKICKASVCNTLNRPLTFSC